ncbi:hypothetical protein HRbin36_02078 [bacterium HR36]|nr:hypothetical protein HRbin36_02078 [bacterium HR36]
MHFVQRSENAAFPQLTRQLGGQVVAPHNDVLAGANDRVTVGRAENVVGGHHQHHGFHLGLDGKRQVNRHLVTVEVGVIALADQRVDTDGVALNQHGLKRLDAHAMQRRSTIQQDRVIACYLLQDVPHHLFAALD